MDMTTPEFALFALSSSSGPGKSTIVRLQFRSIDAADMLTQMDMVSRGASL